MLTLFTLGLLGVFLFLYIAACTDLSLLYSWRGLWAYDQLMHTCVFECMYVLQHSVAVTVLSMHTHTHNAVAVIKFV